MADQDDRKWHDIAVTRDGDDVVVVVDGYHYGKINAGNIDTTQAKFGSATLILDGAEDYVHMPDSAGLAFGDGTFEFDFWIRRAAVSGAPQ